MEKKMDHGALPTLTDDQLIMLVILSEKQAQRFSKPEDYVKMIRHFAIYQYGKSVTFSVFVTCYNELITLGFIHEPRRYMPKGILTSKGFKILEEIQNTERFRILEAQKKPGQCPVFDPLRDCT